MRGIVLIILLTFSLNLAWELLHAPLYGHTMSLGHFLSCLRAAFGDVAIVAAIYGVLARDHGSLYWFHRLTIPKIANIIILGVLVAIAIEMISLGTGRWSYTAAMPLIPILHIGVTPVLQMMILPVLVTYTGSKLITF